MLEVFILLSGALKSLICFSVFNTYSAKDPHTRGIILRARDKEIRIWITSALISNLGAGSRVLPEEKKSKNYQKLQLKPVTKFYSDTVYLAQ